MPKALAVFIAAMALAISLADCGGSSTSSPTPEPSSSFTPDPNITSTTITVTWQTSPLPSAPVAESTPANPASPRPGTPFQTLDTKKDGTVKFGKLDPNKTYCWVATLPKGTSSQCANWTVWQFDGIQLGN
ncbi:MAG TPA: hypothetical protein VGF18_09105 [Candidatus Tumulicola sp.]|jgi:hypothetical protein